MSPFDERASLTVRVPCSVRCCGADEFLKLQAYTLTDYHRVVHLDVDTLILHPVAEIMGEEVCLHYALRYGSVYCCAPGDVPSYR